MNKRALRLLEYDRILELLSEHADSAPGRKLCLELQPSDDREEILRNCAFTSDAIERLLKRSDVSFSQTMDRDRLIPPLGAGRTLEASVLLAAAGFLRCVGRARSFGLNPGENDRGMEIDDSLTPYFTALVPLREISDEIDRCIISEEEIADDASPGLKQIRRAMAGLHARIRKELNRLTTGIYRQYLQDGVITMRDDRYCIPVRAEFKGQVSGIVHDSSSTGQTLFIEPQVIVELNNELRESHIAELEEIERVLAALSAGLAERLDDLEFDLDTMAFLDLTFAKARYALETDAMVPHFNERKAFILRSARHPLLPKDKAVPIDVYLGDAFDLLVITGPNTGGKTVTLKTVGLLTLMGQSGMAIPAGDRSELAVFREVYADIGDEQSIEQSLSTFSSHMTNIVSILEKADEESLCLFDELGAGTDPTEGAALAVAILDGLHKKKIRTIATTHYSECKIYAMTTNGVMNGACDFDMRSLAPTYKLLIGVPGSSNAFAISRKLGLPEEVIDDARRRVDSGAESFDKLLSDLQNSRKKADAEKDNLENLRREVEAQKEELRKKEERFGSERDRILEEANAEARDILKEAKEVADETIRAMNRAGADVRDLEKDRGRVRKKLSEKDEALSKNLGAPKNAGKKVDPAKLSKGDMVRVISMGLTGTVSTLPDKKGDLTINCGIMKTRVNVSDLAAVAEEQDGKRALRSVYGVGEKRKPDISRAKNISSECRLIGMTADEAVACLDRYLDEAVMAHMSSVRIVHGKGTGTLRDAVHRHLKNVPYVKSFKLGEFGEGDSGVTIAQLLI